MICAGQFSWDYERASVLFNVASWHTQCGVMQDRSTPEGTKVAARHFVVRPAVQFCASRSTRSNKGDYCTMVKLWRISSVLAERGQRL